MILKLRRGELYRAEFKESPSTGYLWRIRLPSPTPLQIVEDNFIATRSTEPTIGAPGRRQVSFKFNTSGDFEVVFELCRNWDSQKPIKTVMFHVKVST